MPTAHLICGYFGSGKTTFARELENDRGAVRFTPDEWLVQHYGTAIADDKIAAYSQNILDMIWHDALLALSLGRDVVLDFGFWTRAERDAARARLAGYQTQFYLVVCEEEVSWARLAKRNQQAGAPHFVITRATFDSSKSRVERLGEDEDFILVHKG